MQLWGLNVDNLISFAFRYVFCDKYKTDQGSRDWPSETTGLVLGHYFPVLGLGKATGLASRSIGLGKISIKMLLHKFSLQNCCPKLKLIVAVSILLACLSRLAVAGAALLLPIASQWPHYYLLSPLGRVSRGQGQGSVGTGTLHRETSGSGTWTKF